MQDKTHENGFTLIELLVATVISMMLIGGAVAAFGTYNENQKLHQAALTLKNNFRFAQNKALSSQKPSSNCALFLGYAITFASGSYSIQALCDNGSGFKTQLAGDKTTITLPSGVTFSPVPSQLIFQVLTLGVNVSSPTTITLVGSSKSYELSVSPSGDINDVGFF